MQLIIIKQKHNYINISRKYEIELLHSSLFDRDQVHVIKLCEKSYILPITLLISCAIK
jgi:hypothetical protein